MEDSRVAWMKHRTYAALDLTNDALFEELVARDGKKVGKELVSLLNSPAAGEYSPALIFYPLEHEVEQEVEELEEEIIEQLVEQAGLLEEGQTSSGDEGNGTPSEANGKGSENGDNKEDGGPEKPKKVVKKKMVKKLVRKTEMFLCYKHLPEAISTIGFYFMRTVQEPIPIPSSPQDANATLSQCFEMGTMSNKPLNALERLLTHIYIPMLMIPGQQSGEDEVEPSSSAESQQKQLVADEQDLSQSIGRSESRLKAMMRDELLINVQKFATQVQRTIQQIEGEVKLEMPSDVNLCEEDLSLVARDQQTVSKLEPAMETWARIISATVDEQLHKQPQGQGPLAEIDFWRERNSALSALYEQLKLTEIQNALIVLKMAGVSSYSNFEYHRTELNKYYLEAKDNVKFLGTLERHFKNLAHGANFAIILDTLPAMMNSLRMVWVISRHYNTDERMVPLMGRIAWELCQRVARVVNVRTIFRNSLAVIKARASEGKRCLETWKQSYLDVRRRIEQSGRDARWEFDQKKLFERSNYIAQVCSDIYSVAQTIEEFHNIFGPEMKAVTGDPERIERVLERVDSLVLDVETTRFDPYDPSSRHDWRSVMSRFQQEVKLIEEEANSFINESFLSLRSAEGAFDMLHNFKHIPARDAINATMMRKFNEILSTFEKEVDTINELFKVNKDDPPISKTQPRVAGAISWSRSLFQRIKQTVLRFQTMKELIDSEAGKAASKRYLIVARSMKSYEDDLYTEWIETVEATLPDLLKRTVLCKPPPPLPRSLTQTPISGYTSRTMSRMDQSHIVPPADRTSASR